MLWAVPATGIALCQSAVAIADRRESAYGYKPTWAGFIDAQPSPLEPHALITPPELLNLTAANMARDELPLCLNRQVGLT